MLLKKEKWKRMLEDPHYFFDFYFQRDNAIVDSYQKAIEKYAMIINDVIADPVIEGTVSQDMRFPEWLRKLSGILINGSLKP